MPQQQLLDIKQTCIEFEAAKKDGCDAMRRFIDNMVVKKKVVDEMYLKVLDDHNAKYVYSCKPLNSLDASFRKHYDGCRKNSLDCITQIESFAAKKLQEMYDFEELYAEKTKFMRHKA